MEKKLVLSFDGGGLRGIWPITIISRLYEKYPRIKTQVELFAGASTGGLIAISLAAGIDPQVVREIYLKDGPNIFKRTAARRISSGDGYFAPKFDNKKLIEVVQRSMKDAPITIKELPGRVIIPTFDLFEPLHDCWRPVFFHNYSELGRWDEICWELAVKTSSAPGYFPTYDGYVDGGVSANNPSMIAVGRIVNEYGRGALDEMVLLSLGNGASTNKIDPPQDWGFLKWTKPLIGIFMEGLGNIPDFQCEQFCKNYLRINPFMADGYNFDDPAGVPVLAKHAEEFDITPVEEFLSKNGII